MKVLVVWMTKEGNWRTSNDFNEDINPDHTRRDVWRLLAYESEEIKLKKTSTNCDEHSRTKVTNHDPDNLVVASACEPLLRVCPSHV